MMKTPIQKKSAGFTLVELLVVISVLMILLAILVPSGQKAKYLVKKGMTHTTFAQIQNGCRAYHDLTGEYPASFGRGPGGASGGRSLLYDYLVGPTDSDKCKGYGYRVHGKRSRKFGPFAGLHNIEYKKIDNQNYAFVDAWGNEIYYYRYEKTNTGGSYISQHNSNGPTYLGYLNSAGYWPDIRKDYILISKGDKNEEDDWSTLKYGKPDAEFDDITNFYKFSQ